MKTTTRQDMLDLLSRYAAPKFQVGNIPDKWQKNIAAKFGALPQGGWLAFLNLNIFGGGKEGLLFDETGIWMRYTVHQVYLTWARLEDAGEISVLPGDKVSVGGRYILHTLKGSMPGSVLAEMLTELQTLIRDKGLAGVRWAYDADGYAADEVYARFSSMSRTESIREVCREYAGSPYMPPFRDNTERYIAEGFTVPDNEEILAYLDFNLVIDSKEGIVVTNKGLYWNAKQRRRPIPWEDLYAMAPVALHEDKMLELDSQLLPLDGSKLHAQEILELLRRIISLRPRDGSYKATVFPAHREDQLSDEEKRMLFDKNAIRHICKRHSLLSHPSYYPPVVETYESDDEIVIARNISTITTTVEGLYVTTRGIRFRNSYEDKPAMPVALIPYARLVDAKISVDPADALYIDSWLVFKSEHSGEIAYLIILLQLYCASLRAANSPDFYEKEAIYMDPWLIPVQGAQSDKHWVVAEEGVIRGIWTSIELTYAREHRLFDPSVISVWSPGMDRWDDLENIDLQGEK